MASFGGLKWDIQYAPSDNKKKTRTVGIEFECTVSNINSIFSTQGLHEAERKWREETPDNETRWFNAEKNIKIPEEFPVAAWGYDGGDKEFVTQPDSYTFFLKGGSERFKKVVAYLAKYTEADKLSGTHIHISGKKGDDKQKTWDNLYWCMCGFGLEMQKIFGRSSSWTMPPTISKMLTGVYDYEFPGIHKIEYTKPKDLFKKSTTVSSCKHTMINLHHSGTYEFRGPKSSHDISEILAWVQFCHNMVEICATTNDISSVKFGEFLKGKYIAKYVREISKNKMRIISRTDRLKSIGNKITFSYYTRNKVF